MTTCPTCQKPTVAEFKPFCSKRCREVDLNRWFTGSYAVPAVELDDIDEESIEEMLKTAEKEE
ncbi:MAG: DNA gyrase inhibitor YacG [Rickettsiales bacterium]